METDTTVRDFYVQKGRLESFTHEFEERFEYVAEGSIVRIGTKYEAHTHCGIKPEGEAFASTPDNPTEAVSQYIDYINSLGADANILLWRAKPILDCFEDEEGSRFCTVYSRFALLKEK